MSLYNVIGIIWRWKQFKYMLETDILRNSSQKIFGFPEGCFLRVWASFGHPGALLAKTMPAIFLLISLYVMSDHLWPQEDLYAVEYWNQGLSQDLSCLSIEQAFPEDLLFGLANIYKKNFQFWLIGEWGYKPNMHLTNHLLGQLKCALSFLTQ